MVALAQKANEKGRKVVSGITDTVSVSQGGHKQKRGEQLLIKIEMRYGQ